MEKAPLVSIGMPVYNEAEFLESALDSLAAQDYPNVEILISDNASTDKTPEIARQFAEGREGVRIHRFPENRGIRDNFQKALDMAGGEYFMWAAGHDRWSENYVSECVAALEDHPGAALAFGSSRWIGPMGEELALEYGWTDTRGMHPLSRYFTVLWGNPNPVYGLCRKALLERALPIPNCAGVDLILLSRLCLMGDFLHVPRAVWSRRQPREIETHKQRMARYRSREFGLSRSFLDRRLPLARLPLELLGSIFSSTLPAPQKAVAVVALLPTLLARLSAGSSLKNQ